MNFFRRHTTITQGQAAERYATRWLKQQGLQLITQNYHGRRGEIDSIMLDGNDLVFIEVRYRQASSFSTAIASVDRAKQQRIIHTAQQFLASHSRYHDYPCRFDVVALQGQADGHTVAVDWIKDAFQ